MAGRIVPQERRRNEHAGCQFELDLGKAAPLNTWAFRTENYSFA
jgi:hypothetical protein